MIEHFSHWSLGEHASIASFARFTLQLLALGAPPALVQASIAAGDDERRHAELGFSFLRALGVELAPGPIAIGGSLEQSSLESIFRMVVRESILGETFSALEALHVVPWIRDAVFQRELARLAEDEARHAELGFVFAAWAIGQSPALSAVLEQELASFVEPEIRACAGQREWGVLSTEERRALREVTWREVIGPLCQSLLQLAATMQTAETRYPASTCS
jgi:hypothetical protein